MSSPQIFQVGSLKCEKVVVFADKAEVKRLIKIKLNKDENEIIITNLSNLIDPDSIRVEGCGEATILDVTCQHKRVEVDVVDSPAKLKKLQIEIKEFKEKESLLKAKNKRLEKQLKVLNEFAKHEASIKESSSISNFLDFIEKYEELDKEKLDLNEEISQNTEKLNAAKKNLNTMTNSNFNNTVKITILIEAEVPETEIPLLISYVINNASWSPKYDIRVFSDNKTMIINYYGLISQSTGEDWNDTQVSLSTVVPSISGSIPELKTLNVRIKLKDYVQKRIARKAMVQSCVHQERFRSLTVAENYCDSDLLDVQETIVKDDLTASTFDIPRQVTIPADNSEHKVAIAIINLKAEFEYETVPKKSPHAFLKAKVTNTSAYAMLAGPANVFLDNSFVAKTNLNSYSPQEEIYCSLGVDPSIRVSYKPVRKFQEESGILSRVKTIKYEQIIEVKNTTQNTIKLLLSDQLPLSNDDKIQVKLIEPVLKNNHTVILNKINNLQFDLKINAGKQEDVTIKYSVEHPSNEDIEFV